MAEVGETNNWRHEAGPSFELMRLYRRECDLQNVVKILFCNVKKLYSQIHHNIWLERFGDGADLIRDEGLEYLLHCCLDQCKRLEGAYTWSDEGRLGKSVVQLDKRKCGQFSITSPPIRVSSQDNFSTINANVCIYKGKWQYEMEIGKNGVMQLGWATINCKFSQEKGVGDTLDSYAYDGNRQKKWNRSAHKYGEIWQAGDIISTTIDFDEGRISYYRNGKPLGVAFSKIKMGPGYAYFPAVSLAMGEFVYINFGATPFRHPVAGFQPLQAPPRDDLLKAHFLVLWVSQLVKFSSDVDQCEELASLNIPVSSLQSIFMLIMQQISYKLGPLLENPYIVVDILFPLFYNFVQEDQNVVSSSKTFCLFDLLIGSLEEHELEKCVDSILWLLMKLPRESSKNLEFECEKLKLKLLHTMLFHSKMRKFCLNKMFFDKSRLFSLLSLRMLDEIALQSVFPNVWWQSKDESYEFGNKEEYNKSLSDLEEDIKEIEDYQILIIKLLLTIEDGVPYQNSSRAIFLTQLRKFLMENLASSLVSGVNVTPPLMILHMFYHLLTAFLDLWTEEVDSSNVCVPLHIFFEGKLNYYDIQRLGGLESHLLKTWQKEVVAAMEKSKFMNLELNRTTSDKEDIDMEMDVCVPSTSDVSCVSHLSEVVSKVNVFDHDSEKAGKEYCRESLLHLLDAIIMMYHLNVHKELGKMATQKASILEGIDHIKDMSIRLKYASEQSLDEYICMEIQKSQDVLATKINERVRSYSWTLATAQSYRHHMHLVMLLKFIVNTLNEASKEGPLFAFVPDFYVESLTKISTALRLYFDRPANVFPGYENTFTEVGEFLSHNFSDPRIVYTDSKECLIQSLAGFVAQKITLTSLENMSESCRKQMIVNLLQMYENRSWAQNNWILARFWKGCGFAFRSTKSPHLAHKLGPKPPNSNGQNFTLNVVPCPSVVFQHYLAQILEESEEIATSFLNSLLNHLNWAFSEFIGMLQEIQNASHRPERVFVDSRHLQFCVTCFDLALALLRVLEMVVMQVPQLFLDFSRKSAEFLLSRLCQLLCQVFNRASMSSGCFTYVVGLEIPGLEIIDHFPLLTAATGVLTALLQDDISKGNQNLYIATKALFSEPSFQLTAICNLLGPSTDMECESASPTEIKQPFFSLTKYPSDVSEEELKKVENVISHLNKYGSYHIESLSKEDEDVLCTICYASPSTALFIPCEHSSCKACITRYLMNRTDCFFCKANIMSVKDLNTNEVVFQQNSENSSKNPKRSFPDNSSNL